MALLAAERRFWLGWTGSRWCTFALDTTLALTLSLLGVQRRMLALQLQSLSLNTGIAPVARMQRAQSPVMVKSQALPFLEAPGQLDGSLAGDKVRRCCPARPKSRLVDKRVDGGGSLVCAESLGPCAHLSPPPCLQGFDPLNLSGAFDMNWMREAELKHGRVCMLAWAGYVAVDNGLYVPFAPHVSSLAAHDTAVKSGNMLLVLGAAGVFEVRRSTALARKHARQTPVANRPRTAHT